MDSAEAGSAAISSSADHDHAPGSSQVARTTAAAAAAAESSSRAAPGLLSEAGRPLPGALSNAEELAGQDEVILGSLPSRHPRQKLEFAQQTPLQVGGVDLSHMPGGLCGD